MLATDNDHTMASNGFLVRPLIQPQAMICARWLFSSLLFFCLPLVVVVVDIVSPNGRQQLQQQRRQQTSSE